MSHIENNRLTKYIGTNDLTMAITDYQSKQNRKKTNKQTNRLVSLEYILLTFRKTFKPQLH